jgi:NAD(P)-dependent dehydrogenase (short-subunit alcohol dehydrogenase family)
MGLATALALAERGFAVALADVDEARLDAALQLVEQKAPAACAVVTDVADTAAVERAVEECRRRLGPLWFVGAAAAILEPALALSAGEEHFRRIFDVNFMGVVRTAVAAGRAMVEQGAGGRIVTWSSTGAVGGNPGYSAYGASKAAVSSFTQSLALELAPHRITVNAILPGAIRTPMVGYFDGEAHEAERKRIPLLRWGEPEDVAAAACFLAGDEAAWITGVTLNVDGGTLASRGRGGPEAIREELRWAQAYAASGERRLPGEPSAS